MKKNLKNKINKKWYKSKALMIGGSIASVGVISISVVVPIVLSIENASDFEYKPSGFVEDQLANFTINNDVDWKGIFFTNEISESKLKEVLKPNINVNYKVIIVSDTNNKKYYENLQNGEIQFFVEQMYKGEWKKISPPLENQTLVTDEWAIDSYFFKKMPENQVKSIYINNIYTLSQKIQIVDDYLKTNFSGKNPIELLHSQMLSFNSSDFIDFIFSFFSLDQNNEILNFKNNLLDNRNDLIDDHSANGFNVFPLSSLSSSFFYHNFSSNSTSQALSSFNLRSSSSSFECTNFGFYTSLGNLIDDFSFNFNGSSFEVKLFSSTASIFSIIFYFTPFSTYSESANEVTLFSRYFSSFNDWFINNELNKITFI